MVYGRSGRSDQPWPDHVVGGDAEVRGQARDIAGVGLQVPAGAVQQHQVGTGSGPQHPGAHAADVDVAQLVVGVGQLAPDADVLGQVAHVDPVSSGNRARASATVHSPALCRRLTPSACSRREFSMVRNSTGSPAESL